MNRDTSAWGRTSNRFDPNRWLAEDAASLDKYMTSFYRGTRQCLGMKSVMCSPVCDTKSGVRKWLTSTNISLAWCELYLLISTLFRQYEVKVHETTPDDMAWTDHLLMLYVCLGLAHTENISTY